MTILQARDRRACILDPLSQELTRINGGGEVDPLL